MPTRLIRAACPAADTDVEDRRPTLGALVSTPIKRRRRLLLSLDAATPSPLPLLPAEPPSRRPASSSPTSPDASAPSTSSRPGRRAPSPSTPRRRRQSHRCRAPGTSASHIAEHLAPGARGRPDVEFTKRRSRPPRQAPRPRRRAAHGGALHRAPPCHVKLRPAPPPRPRPFLFVEPADNDVLALDLGILCDTDLAGHVDAPRSRAPSPRTRRRDAAAVVTATPFGVHGPDLAFEPSSPCPVSIDAASRAPASHPRTAAGAPSISLWLHSSAGELPTKAIPSIPF